MAQNAILPMDLNTQERPNSFVSTKAMLWHNAIIDDMLAHPGTTQKATAERLGRSAVTIGYIVNSDLFKLQLKTRREQFTKELDARLIGKLGQLAEKSLDLQIEKLEKTATGVPLPLLNDISNSSLDRLGYGTKPSTPAVEVNITNTNATQVVAPVSREALASARDTLRTLESVRSTPQAVLGNPLAPAQAVECGGAAETGEGFEGAL